MQLADLVLMVLGWFLAAWGASLVLRALAVKMASLRRAPPFKFMFRGSSPFDPAPGAMAGWRVGVTVIGGCVSVIAGLWCLRLRPNLNTEAGYDSGDVWAGAASGLMVAFAGGAFLLGLFADRSRGRRRCPKCWYDMAALERMVCPECGHEAKRERDLFRTRRSRGMVLVAVLLLFGAILPGKIAAFRRGGLLAVTPTPVLIAFFERLPPTWVQQFTPRTDTVLSEGPLLSRLTGRGGWREEWFARRVEKLLLATSDRTEFGTLLGIRMSLRGPEVTEDQRDFQKRLVVACGRHGADAVCEATSDRSTFQRVNCMRAAAGLLSYVQPQTAEGVLTGEAVARVAEALDDPDDALVGATIGLIAYLPGEDIDAMVRRMLAKISEGERFDSHRMSMWQLGSLCSQSGRARTIWLEAVRNRATPDRGVLLARIGQYNHHFLDQAELERYAREDDARLSSAAIFLLTDMQSEKMEMQHRWTCEEILAALGSHREGHGWLLWAADRLRCEDPAFLEYVERALKSEERRGRRAALFFGSERGYSSAAISEAVAAILTDPTLDQESRSWAMTWAAQLGLPPPANAPMPAPAAAPGE